VDRLAAYANAATTVLYHSLAFEEHLTTYFRIAHIKCVTET